MNLIKLAPINKKNQMFIQALYKPLDMGDCYGNVHTGSWLRNYY